MTYISLKGGIIWSYANQAPLVRLHSYLRKRVHLGSPLRHRRKGGRDGNSKTSKNAGIV